MPQQPGYDNEQIPLGSLQVYPTQPLNNMRPLERTWMMQKWQEQADPITGPHHARNPHNTMLGTNKLLQLLQAEAMNSSGTPYMPTTKYDIPPEPEWHKRQRAWWNQPNSTPPWPEWGGSLGVRG